MALTQAVPAGIYARAGLTALGFWDGVAGRLAQTDNVRAALMLTIFDRTREIDEYYEDLLR